MDGWHEEVTFGERGLMANPEFVALRGIWPMKGDVLSRREILYRIQGYYNYAYQAGDFYDEATHYIVANPSAMEVARPKGSVLACIRLNKRRIDQDFVEDWFVLRRGEKETTWNIIASGFHRKYEVVGNKYHNDFPHLKDGEEVFFVHQCPIPTDIGHKLIPWRGRLS